MFRESQNRVQAMALIHETLYQSGTLSGINMQKYMGASTPAIDKLHTLCETSPADKTRQVSIATINRLFMLTLPAHLQLNYGKPLDPNGRDALRAKIIRSALNQDT